MGIETRLAELQSSAIVNQTTVIALTTIVLIVLSAYTLSISVLPRKSPLNLRLIFGWHMFDSLLHIFIEGVYLYDCFFISSPRPAIPYLSFLPSHLAQPMTPYGVHFLNDPSRLYGAFYGDSPPAKLWQEYARADRRWGGADLGIISLELLTVFVMAPAGLAACWGIWRRNEASARFWAIIVGTGELYGGFMTFAPEWLSGSPNLDCSNFLYFWVYLMFLNLLWVFVPAWIMYDSYVFFTSLKEPKSVDKGVNGDEQSKKDS